MSIPNEIRDLAHALGNGFLDNMVAVVEASRRSDNSTAYVLCLSNGRNFVPIAEIMPIDEAAKRFNPPSPLQSRTVEHEVALADVLHRGRKQ